MSMTSNQALADRLWFFDTHPPPVAETSGLYITNHSETVAGKVRRTIVGMHVILAPGHANGLFDGLCVKPDIGVDPKQPTVGLHALLLVCDRLQIDGELWLPECDVTIHARRIEFGPNGRIKTTPQRWTRPAGADAEHTSADPRRGEDGAHGRKAGDITVWAGELAEAGTLAQGRFEAIGGAGQDPGQGKDGVAGRSVVAVVWPAGGATIRRATGRPRSARPRVCPSAERRAVAGEQPRRAGLSGLPRLARVGAVRRPLRVADPAVHRRPVDLHPPELEALYELVKAYETTVFRPLAAIDWKLDAVLDQVQKLLALEQTPAGLLAQAKALEPVLAANIQKIKESLVADYGLGEAQSLTLEYSVSENKLTWLGDHESVVIDPARKGLIPEDRERVFLADVELNKEGVVFAGSTPKSGNAVITLRVSEYGIVRAHRRLYRVHRGAGRAWTWTYNFSSKQLNASGSNQQSLDLLRMILQDDHLRQRLAHPPPGRTWCSRSATRIWASSRGRRCRR